MFLATTIPTRHPYIQPMRAAALLLLALTLACTPADLAFPSPDGTHTAFVRNHWSIDPPRQSLWVDGAHIVDLAEDQDWCRKVVWAADGATVTFLVKDEKPVVVDVARKRIADDDRIAPSVP